MRINSKGQVTIPREIRARAGLLPNTEVDFVFEQGEVRIVKARDPRTPTRGAMAVDALRRSGGGVTMTTEEIMAHTRTGA